MFSQFHLRFKERASLCSRKGCKYESRPEYHYSPKINEQVYIAQNVISELSGGNNMSRDIFNTNHLITSNYGCHFLWNNDSVTHKGTLSWFVWNPPLNNHHICRSWYLQNAHNHVAIVGNITLFTRLLQGHIISGMCANCIVFHRIYYCDYNYWELHNT
jgi:hypothetical protein